ncbi:MAG: hypothetical protein LBK95_15355 [Bifidobacteriaceae bacterium]|jgi:hypothetical protein|nr:hypothetical protein [Bifidobacteriaceae bacterium]
MSKKNPRPPKPWAIPNPELARAMQELRRSSATSPHRSRADKPTRAEARREAVQDSANEGRER